MSHEELRRLRQKIERYGSAAAEGPGAYLASVDRALELWSLVLTSPTHPLAYYPKGYVDNYCESFGAEGAAFFRHAKLLSEAREDSLADVERHVAAPFAVVDYSGPARVLELHFCPTLRRSATRPKTGTGQLYQHPLQALVTACAPSFLQSLQDAFAYARRQMGEAMIDDRDIVWWVSLRPAPTPETEAPPQPAHASPQTALPQNEPRAETTVQPKQRLSVGGCVSARLYGSSAGGAAAKALCDMLANRKTPRDLLVLAQFRKQPDTAQSTEWKAAARICGVYGVVPKVQAAIDEGLRRVWVYGADNYTELTRSAAIADKIQLIDATSNEAEYQLHGPPDRTETHISPPTSGGWWTAAGSIVLLVVVAIGGGVIRQGASSGAPSLAATPAPTFVGALNEHGDDNDEQPPEDEPQMLSAATAVPPAEPEVEPLSSSPPNQPRPVPRTPRDSACDQLRPGNGVSRRELASAAEQLRLSRDEIAAASAALTKADVESLRHILRCPSQP